MEGYLEQGGVTSPNMWTFREILLTAPFNRNLDTEGGSPGGAASCAPHRVQWQWSSLVSKQTETFGPSLCIVCAWFLVRVRYLLRKEREVHRICCAPEYSYLGGLHLHNMSQYRGGAACLAVLWNPEIIRVKTATKDYINWGNNWQIQNMWLATLHPTPLHAPPYKTNDIQCHKIVVCCFDQFFKSSSTKNTSSKMLH